MNGGGAGGGAGRGWPEGTRGSPPQPRLTVGGAGSHRHWEVSSRHHQTCTLDYGYLLGLLEDMQAHWEEASSLPQEQVSSPGLAGSALPGG